ncbi:MAG: hypothetical protein ACOCYB_06840 [Alkalispirochaeta sp.]
MPEQNEQIRITATDTDLQIIIDKWPADVSFDATSSVTPVSESLPMDFLQLTPSERAEEFVITFEFDTSHRDGPERRKLQRLDAHVKNVSVRLRDDGYVLEGELTGWVGYTAAAVQSRSL